MVITKEDREKLKEGSANFVAKDLRPYYAVECEGLIDFATACMEFGQRHRSATRDDLCQVIPSRNCVAAYVNSKADEKRKIIGGMMKEAMEHGGLAASTDTCTDDYRHNTYITVVVHLARAQNHTIQYDRFILSTSEITEIVKSGIQRFS